MGREAAVSACYSNFSRPRACSRSPLAKLESHAERRRRRGTRLYRHSATAASGFMSSRRHSRYLLDKKNAQKTRQGRLGPRFSILRLFDFRLMMMRDLMMPLFPRAASHFSATQSFCSPREVMRRRRDRLALQRAAWR